ncbi:L,D-transpeptidase [Arcanobacterium hippocoleae]|uniref:L,D-transpeptidase n=1 Tax=Arcanobacterium hippocoleae TaxID=149017 RepID=UPI00333F4E0C
MSRRKIAVISIISGFAILIFLLAGYLLYFWLGGRALPGMKVGKVDVSGKTASEISADLNTAAATEKINFTGANLDGNSAKLNEIGITLQASEVAAAALAPNSSFSSYFTIPFTGKTIEPKLEIDKEKLNASAVALAAKSTGAKTVVEPKILVAGEGFKIQAGESGAGIDPQIFHTAAQELVETQKSVAAKVKLSEIKPKYTVADLERTKAEAEKLLATEVSVTAEGKTVSADTKTKIGFITFNENKAEVNEAAMKEWLTQVAAPHNQEKITGTRNVNAAGQVLEVVTAAHAEKNVTNFDAALKTLQAAFSAKQPAKTTLDVHISEETWTDRIIARGAEHLPYKATEGEKWIDVNLSTFKMTAYEGATRVRGPITVVTGEKGAETITGKFKIWHKTKTQSMRGTHQDGSKYDIKNVPANMFFHGDYAIHGAPWWGPNEWGFQGSNGCVNTPVPDAKWLFNWAPIGTVVVTHY